jgi:hypothetical protein
MGAKSLGQDHWGKIIGARSLGQDHWDKIIGARSLGQGHWGKVIGARSLGQGHWGKVIGARSLGDLVHRVGPQSSNEATQPNAPTAIKPKVISAPPRLVEITGHDAMITPAISKR